MVCSAVPEYASARRKGQHMNHSRARARFLAAVLTTIILSTAAVLAVGAGPAFAHDQLLESNPAENAVLDSAPAEVTLTYSNSVLTIGAIVLLVDEHGKNWIDGEPIYDGSRVIAAVSGELPEGAYEIRWRVVSVDGHPISDVIPFTVGDAAPAPQATSSSHSSEEPKVAPDPAASNQNGDSMRTVLIGIGGAVAALLLLWAATAWNRHRNRNQRTNPTSRTPTL